VLELKFTCREFCPEQIVCGRIENAAAGLGFTLTINVVLEVQLLAFEITV
jgi:hypothetical protein